jgi:hypothetical protein
MLSTSNFNAYIAGFKILNRIVYVWPPLSQVNEIGSKKDLLSNLDAIALTITKTLRPKTKELQYGDDIPVNTVIKRSHSDCGLHVFRPGDAGRNWESFGRLTHVPGATWFSQTYVPALAKLGEWRVFIIGGEIIYTVHTRYDPEKGVWMWDPVNTYYSLRELRYTFFKIAIIGYLICFLFSELATQQKLLSMKSPCNPVEGSHQVRKEAETEFFEFVRKTYNGLYQLESRAIFARPTIGIFCRLDIGLIEHQNQVHYFVNEVERTQTASLWSNPSKNAFAPSRIGLFGSTFANALYRYLRDLEKTTLF